ncbi:MAG: ABC transporter permease [Actinomycetota bacterium]|nr:ABC transporter permease [Actinomycetota bacterium]
MKASTRATRARVLLAMQLARLRTAWRPYLIVSSAMPLGIALLMRAIMDREQVAQFGEQIVAGCAVLAIAMTAIVMLAQRVAALKESGGLDFYATLPVSRSALVLSILISFAVFALPGMLIVLAGGAALFDLSFAALWSALPVWLAGSIALAGIGVALGFIAPDEQLAGMYSNLAMMAVLFLGILPADKVPDAFGPVRAALPSTYAVDALKPGLSGTIAASQAWDVTVLLAFGALSFWAIAGPLWPRSE